MYSVLLTVSGNQITIHAIRYMYVQNEKSIDD